MGYTRLVAVADHGLWLVCCISGWLVAWLVGRGVCVGVWVGGVGVEAVACSCRYRFVCLIVCYGGWFAELFVWEGVGWLVGRLGGRLW